MEDLWAFNEEVTARAIFCLRASGHFRRSVMSRISRLRTLLPTCAPPPSGAAELASCLTELVRAELTHTGCTSAYGGRRRAEQNAEKAAGRSAGAAVERTPVKYIEEKRLLLTQTEERLFSAVPVRLETERNRLNGLQNRLLAAGRKAAPP